MATCYKFPITNPGDDLDVWTRDGQNKRRSYWRCCVILTRLSKRPSVKLLESELRNSRTLKFKKGLIFQNITF